MAHISGLKLCSLLWVCLQWSLWFHGIVLSDVHVNRSSAEQQCENYGGLLSYETFLNENVKNSWNKMYQQIDDGGPAWVSELVNYSQFISWHGCYLKSALKNETATPTFALTGKSVSSCFNPCNNTKHLLYIGIHRNERYGYQCYCISTDELNEALPHDSPGVKFLFNQSNLGSVFPECTMFHICHKKDILPKINVYKLHDIKQKLFPKSYEQCVYAYKVTGEETNFTLEYGTKSCLAYGKESQNGYICVETGTHTMTSSCTNSFSIKKKYCIIHATSDWYQAQSQCVGMNARLVDVIPEELTQHLRTNVTYWTGLIREFKIISSPSEISEGDVCLSVKKDKTEFVLEAANCSDVKLKLCQNETLSIEFVDEQTVTFVTVDDNKSPNVNDTTETRLKISLTFNSVLLLIIVCLAIVLYRRRREPAQILYRQTCEKATTTTRSNDTLADDSVFNAIASDEYHGDSHHYACPDNTATGTDRHENKYDNPHDFGAKQYDHICLRNASHQNLGHSDNINVSDYSHINASQQHGGHGDNVNVSDYSHINALAKVTASNQTMYEEIKVQTLDSKTETEL